MQRIIDKRGTVVIENLTILNQCKKEIMKRRANQVATKKRTVQKKESYNFLPNLRLLNLFLKNGYTYENTALIPSGFLIQFENYNYQNQVLNNQAWSLIGSDSSISYQANSTLVTQELSFIFPNGSVIGTDSYNPNSEVLNYLELLARPVLMNRMMEDILFADKMNAMSPCFDYEKVMYDDFGAFLCLKSGNPTIQKTYRNKR